MSSGSRIEIKWVQHAFQIVSIEKLVGKFRTEDNF
jgi:hypothetical protein